MTIGALTFSATSVFQPTYVAHSAAFSPPEVYSTSTNEPSFQTSNDLYGHTAAAGAATFANELAREHGFPWWAQTPLPFGRDAQPVHG